jgi:hypothetical protein
MAAMGDTTYPEAMGWANKTLYDRQQMMLPYTCMGDASGSYAAITMTAKVCSSTWDWGGKGCGVLVLQTNMPWMSSVEWQLLWQL